MLVAEEAALSERAGHQPPVAESSPPLLTPVSRWVLVGFVAAFLVLTFTQSSGQIEFDTKLPMLMEPLTYITSALHLWNQNIFGGTGDAGTGFLFPMGFFFALTHLLHVPVWGAERLWLGLLLTTGFWGVVRLAEALRIGTRWARVLAGVAYVVAPLVITWASVTTP